MGRLFKSLFKFVFNSLLLGVISLVVSTSFMSGKFPPDWKQIKNILGTVQRLKEFQKTATKGVGGGNGGLITALGEASVGSQLTHNQQILENINQAKAVANQANANQANIVNKAAITEDPEMADIREALKSRQSMQNVAASLSGEKIADLTASTKGQLNNNQIARNQAVHDQATSNNGFSTENRMKALEAQVENLTLRLRSLASMIEEINNKIEHQQKVRR